MVYLTVGYLGALQYIQISATTVVCLTVDGPRPPEASLTHSVVQLFAPRLTSVDVNLLTRSCMINCSAVCPTRRCSYLTCRSEAYLAHLLCDNRTEASQCLLLLKVPGDSNSPPYLNGYREIPTLPLLCGGRPLVKGRPRRYKNPLCRTSLPRRYQHSRYLSRETDTYSASALPLVQNPDSASYSLTLHTEDSLSGRQTANDLSIIVQVYSYK